MTLIEDVTPGLPSPSASMTRGSAGSVGSTSLAGSSSTMPIAVGVAGRTMRRRPSTSVTSTGVAIGLIAAVAASEMETSTAWSMTVSALQNVIWFHSCAVAHLEVREAGADDEGLHQLVLVGDGVEVGVPTDEVLGSCGERRDARRRAAGVRDAIVTAARATGHRHGQDRQADDDGRPSRLRS